MSVLHFSVVCQPSGAEVTANPLPTVEETEQKMEINKVRK